MTFFSIILLGLSLGILVGAMQSELNRDVIIKMLFFGGSLILFYTLTSTFVFGSSASIYTIISFITAVAGAYTLLVFKYIIRNG